MEKDSLLPTWENFQGGSRELSSIHTGASLEEEDHACVVHCVPLCKQSAQPDQCLLHLVECRVTLWEIKCFLLCVECTCSLTHEDRPRSSVNGKRLSLTNLEKFQASNREHSSTYNNLRAGSREPSIYTGASLEATERKIMCGALHSTVKPAEKQQSSEEVICYQLELGK